MGEPKIEAMLAEMQAVLEALSPKESADDPGLTRQEWADALRMSPGTMRRMLQELDAAGGLAVGHRMTFGIDRRRCRVPVYRPKTP